MLNRCQVSAIFAAACFAGVFLGTKGADADVRRAGVINQFKGVDEIVEACTTTKTFVKVPQMERPFVSSGSANSVVVIFSASASLNGEQFDTGFVRLVIDGNQQSPGEVPFVSEGELSGAHSFTWQSAPLAAGSHVARIQWRTDLESSFCLDARSLIVQFR